jgi:hypothetical protein
MLSMTIDSAKRLAGRIAGRGQEAVTTGPHVPRAILLFMIRRAF